MNFPRIVVEEDHFLKTVPVILDPATPAEHQAAVADFFAHDLDFIQWRDALRQRLSGLFPATVTFAEDQADFDTQLRDADGAIVESFVVTSEALENAPKLHVVHKFGHLTANIDERACAARNIAVHRVRRRVNVAVAEQAFALMIALGKRVNDLSGVVTADALAKAGYPLRPYDRRFIGNANFARIPNLRALQGATLGIVGLGEVGREIAARARAFEMNILYQQRRPLPAADEAALAARYVPLPTLLAQSDYVVLQVPLNDSTRGMIGRKEIAHIKPGAILVNVARAEIVQRDALIEALDSGRVAGLGLDVGYSEPAKPDDSLLTYKDGNVILMPHTGVANRHLAAADLEEVCLNLARGLNR
jgi:lactate dehydrogenase-like 2-hydroxyacid dehydrogenase